MPRSTVISGLITKFDNVINGTDTSAIELAVFKLAMCQLVDAAFSSGGGGGGGTTPQIVSDGIDQSIDINTIIARLGDLVAKPNPPSQSDITTAINAAADIDTIIARLTSLDTGKLTQANVETAIQSAADIDTIVARLTTIAANTAGGGGGTVSTPIAAYSQLSPTVTDTGIVVLALNTNRKGAAIVNRSTTNSVDLFFGALGAYGTGLPLAPGQPYEVNSTNLYTGVIRAITSAGITAVLAVVEGT